MIPERTNGKAVALLALALVVALSLLVGVIL